MLGEPIGDVNHLTCAPPLVQCQATVALVGRRNSRHCGGCPVGRTTLLAAVTFDLLEVQSIQQLKRAYS